jgi:hypothetical protein
MKRIRTLAALSLIGLLATCAEPTGDSSGAPGFARVAIRAVAPPSLARFAPALVVEQVSVIIGNAISDSTETFDTVASRTAPFSEASNQLNLSLQLPVAGTDTLDLRIEYQTLTGTVLFVTSSEVVVGTGRTATPNLPAPDYVGPGSNISFMFLNGDDTTVTAGSDVQLEATAFDGGENEVTEFYLTWSTDDPRVTISPRGLLHTRPDVTQLVTVTARTPNGVEAVTSVTSQSTALLALAPDSVDLRPGEEQIFELTVGRNFDIGTTGSVGGVDGGDATLGTIDENGLYTAPALTLPNGETEVCIRDSNNANTRGCAKVRMTAGGGDADIVMINDLNLFDNEMMAGAGNQRFVQNLIASTGGGSRSRGTVVWSDRSRNSACIPPNDSNNECGDALKSGFFAAIQAAGYSVVSHDQAVADLEAIPGDVRALILWMPLLQFTPAEVNGLKRFAAQGGRLIFIGENGDYYTQAGIDVENQLLRDLGSAMVNRGDLIDCFLDLPAGATYFTTPTRSLRAHPLTSGVTDIRYLCASEIRLGRDDKPLFYDQANRKVLGAVAAISLEALDLPQNFVRQDLRQPSRTRDSRGRAR